MTDTLGARRIEEKKTAAGLFMNFQFLRLDGSYQALLANERVVAKQELLAAFDTSQRKVPLATYTLTGLRSDCDIMLWRVTQHLEDLQAMSYRLQSSGMGKYLVPIYSYLGLVNDPAYGALIDSGKSEAPRAGGFGSARYVFVQPLILEASSKRQAVSQEYQRLAAGHPEVRMHLADSLGFDDQDFVLAFETDQPRGYAKLANELRESAAAPLLSRDRPAFTCVLRDIRDIVDALG